MKYVKFKYFGKTQYGIIGRHEKYFRSYGSYDYYEIRCVPKLFIESFFIHPEQLLEFNLTEISEEEYLAAIVLES